VLPVVRGVRYQGVVTRDDLLARAGNAARANNTTPKPLTTSRSARLIFAP
jgi:hypothetical protein